MPRPAANKSNFDLSAELSRVAGNAGVKIIVLIHKVRRLWLHIPR